MLIALLVSIGLLAAGHYDPAIETTAGEWLRRGVLDDTLMQGMISFVLFARAWQINLDDLAECLERSPVRTHHSASSARIGFPSQYQTPLVSVRIR